MTRHLQKAWRLPFLLCQNMQSILKIRAETGNKNARSNNPIKKKASHIMTSTRIRNCITLTQNVMFCSDDRSVEMWLLGEQCNNWSHEECEGRTKSRYTWVETVTEPLYNSLKEMGRIAGQSSTTAKNYISFLLWSFGKNYFVISIYFP